MYAGYVRRTVARFSSQKCNASSWKKFYYQRLTWGLINGSIIFGRIENRCNWDQLWNLKCALRQMGYRRIKFKKKKVFAYLRALRNTFSFFTQYHATSSTQKKKNMYENSINSFFGSYINALSLLGLYGNFIYKNLLTLFGLGLSLKIHSMQLVF